MKIAPAILISVLSANILAEDIALGDSPEKLNLLFGAPIETTELTLKEKTFITYYYDKDKSYVIDKEKNIICEIGSGTTEGYCYPCDYGPSAGTCP